MTRIPLSRVPSSSRVLVARAASALSCVAALAALLSGCAAFTKLEPEPTPTPVPTPRADLFDPKDGVMALTKLNDSDPASPQLPDKFRVARVDTGELLGLTTISTVGGKVFLGTTDVYRLAGIVTPAPGQPGFQDVVSRIQRWTLGQDVDVEQDPKFPIDLNSRRMVQVFFTGRDGATRGERLLLNRMLVRLGLAVVDINAPTSIDVKPWLNDEQFARDKRLGLWGKGIILAQRIPLQAPPGRAQRVVAPGGAISTQATGTTGATSSTTTSTSSSTTTSTTTSASPVASPGASPVAP